ncbi:MAG: DUF4215 domain-containing protein [Candidatus Altiarchaeota archaeon]
MVKVGWVAVLFLLMLGTASAASCGNNNAEGSEECDGTDLRGYNCNTICKFDKDSPKDYSSSAQQHIDYYCGPYGSLSCKSDCKFKSTCHYSLCGDGAKEGAEECDNGQMNSDSAPDACRTDCVLPSCGDYAIDSGEECDDDYHNSDEIPNACRKDCRRAHCGDGVLDDFEECDVGNANANDGCYQCMLCYNPVDDLRIGADARLCEGTYTIADSGEEGVIIVSGSDLTLDCNGAALIAPDTDLGAQHTGANVMATIPTTSSTLKPTAPTIRTTATLVKGLATSSTTTLKATTTTLKTTVTIPNVAANVGLVQTTSTTASTVTTLKFTFTPITISKAAVTTSTTSTTLKSFVGFTKRPVFANPNAVVFRQGTGIKVTGSNVLLVNCDVRNYRTGIKVGGSGSVLVWNKACGNSEDIRSDSQGNYGVLNSCDSAPTWTENGQPGCMLQCEAEPQQTQTTPTTATTTTQPKGGGFFDRIAGMIFGS